MNGIFYIGMKLILIKWNIISFQIRRFYTFIVENQFIDITNLYIKDKFLHFNKSARKTKLYCIKHLKRLKRIFNNNFSQKM